MGIKGFAIPSVHDLVPRQLTSRNYVFSSYPQRWITTAKPSGVRVGIVGTGPAAIYTAKYLMKTPWPKPLHIDFLDQSPLPYGLLRYGVAPDHPEMRNAAHEFDRLCPNQPSSTVRFFGQVKLVPPSHLTVSAEESSTALVSLEQLTKSFDTVLLAVGAQSGLRLSIPGSHLHGIMAAGDIAKWYNGFTTTNGENAKDNKPVQLASERSALVNRLHFLDQGGCSIRDNVRSNPSPHLTIIGHGNVALDIARVLTRNLDGAEIHPQVRSLIESLNIRSVDIIGRRGLLDASFSPSELREVLSLGGVTTMVDPYELQLSSSTLLPSSGRREKKMLDIYNKMAANWTPERNPPSESTKFIRILSHRHPVSYSSGDGSSSGWVESIHFDNTRTRIREPSASEESNPTIEIRPTSLVVESIGFQQSSVGLPLASNQKSIQNVDGRIWLNANDKDQPSGFPIYAAGWCRGGPRGTIASVIPEAMKIAEMMKADFHNGKWGSAHTMAC